MILNDYEVLGLTSDGRHFFWNSWFLHDMGFPLGAFVGAACRSLTPAQRSGANGDRQTAQAIGTGAFVGELRGSGASAGSLRTLQGWLIKRLFEV